MKLYGFIIAHLLVLPTKISEPLHNPSNAELNPIRHLLVLVAARHIVHVSRVGVNLTSKKWHYWYSLCSGMNICLFFSVTTPRRHFPRAPRGLCRLSNGHDSWYHQQGQSLKRQSLRRYSQQQWTNWRLTVSIRCIFCVDKQTVHYISVFYNHHRAFNKISGAFKF